MGKSLGLSLALAASLCLPALPLHGQVQGADSLLDFSRIRTDRAPGNRVAAAPHLHEARVPVRATDSFPVGSRLLFVNNIELYGGNAVRPTFSENFLTLDVPEVVPSSFVLEFGEPLAELTFTVPALFAATQSGIIFPAFTATAFDSAGGRVDQAGRALLRSWTDVPLRTFTLRASGRRGIARVIFSSDPERVAAFRAILIEELRFRRMAVGRR